MTTGEKIAALRREAGLSQEALADRLGISRQAVSKWEADQAVPGMDNLMELSRIFGVSVDHLLRPDGELPGGKEAGAEEKSSEAAVSGYTVSFKPTLTKKTKAVVIAVALLLCASVVCNIISLTWLVKLQDEVNRIPRNSNTVYVPAPDTSQPEQSDMADVTVDYSLDENDPTQLSLRISAMPREVDSEETAQFCIKGGGENLTVDTAYANGGYTAETLYPLMDEVSVYLLLSKNGTTRNLQVANLSDLNREFALDITISFEPESGGGLVYTTGTAGGFGSLTGKLCIAAQNNTSKIFPVSGRVVLCVGEQEYDSVMISGIAERVEEWLEPDMAYAEMYYYVDLPWDRIDAASYEEISWYVELTDNLGRVTQYTM